MSDTESEISDDSRSPSVRSRNASFDKRPEISIISAHPRIKKKDSIFEVKYTFKIERPRVQRGRRRPIRKHIHDERNKEYDDY